MILPSEWNFPRKKFESTIDNAITIFTADKCAYSMRFHAFFSRDATAHDASRSSSARSTQAALSLRVIYRARESRMRRSAVTTMESPSLRRTARANDWSVTLNDTNKRKQISRRPRRRARRSSWGKPVVAFYACYALYEDVRFTFP